MPFSEEQEYNDNMRKDFLSSTCRPPSHLSLVNDKKENKILTGIYDRRNLIFDSF